MTLTAALSHLPFLATMAPELSAHGYWIVLTILVVMKPGFALTRQRNGWRLAGTLIGCALALVLFNVTHNPDVYLAVLVVTRSEEHTSELQSLMRISYAVFCLKKKNTNNS